MKGKGAGQLRALKGSQGDLLVPKVRLSEDLQINVERSPATIVADLQRSGGEVHTLVQRLEKGTQHILSWACKRHCSVSLEVHDLTESQQCSFTNLFIGSVACTTACMGGQMTTQDSLVSPSST